MTDFSLVSAPLGYELLQVMGLSLGVRVFDTSIKISDEERRATIHHSHHFLYLLLVVSKSPDIAPKSLKERLDSIASLHLIGFAS